MRALPPAWLRRFGCLASRIAALEGTGKQLEEPGLLLNVLVGTEDTYPQEVFVPGQSPFKMFECAVNPSYRSNRCYQ